MPELVTLDSSVIVAALRKTEVHHDRCLSLLEEVKDGFYSAVEPYIVLVEIAAALKRRTGSQKLSERVIKDILTIDTIFFLDLDAARANRAVEIAQRFSVRGMDAIVIQIAEEFDATLLSLDYEIIGNVAGLVKTKAIDEI
jgi:predicted nucleic acid-binding protein